MDGEGEIERAVRKLSVEHAETRWLALRLDDDVKEIRQELRTMHEEQTARFDSIDGALEQHGARLQEHGGRIDSVDAQLRTLTQMVGQVLERLPEESDT
jgi:chromosome segregation ATPase